MRYALPVAATLLLALPAAAQPDGGLRPLSRSGDLKAALDAGDERALAYVVGALDALILRGSQGDPLLFWTRQCVSATFLPVEDVIPHVVAWIDANPDAPSMADLASNAVLMGLAAYCAEETAFEVRTPQ